MTYTVKMTATFRKDYKLAIRRNLPVEKLDWAVKQLAAGNVLPPQFHDHALSGNWTGFRECHITPDWLLLYYYVNNICVLTLARTGTHADIFWK